MSTAHIYGRPGEGLLCGLNSRSSEREPYWLMGQMEKLDYMHNRQGRVCYGSYEFCEACCSQLCQRCWQPKKYHAEDKCLFQETSFQAL